MGKNKHWVLLANDIDHTLIRNKITLDFAGAIGMKFASESELVSVFLNGNYQPIMKELMAKMKEASAEMEFEEAAKYRDLLESVFIKEVRERLLGREAELTAMIKMSNDWIAIADAMRPYAFIGAYFFDFAVDNHRWLVGVDSTSCIAKDSGAFVARP
jgi:hypothetical protein